uniref:Haem-binding uptake Tiki superfamily ChaN domain-containing protein n=1 Tax=Cyanothece sp. (strain PCC 7425 / ATCC 29141) TaxID=395961 RepID=B8HKB1_CYAP4
MLAPRFTRICAYSLLLMLLGQAPILGQEISSLGQPGTFDHQTIVTRLAQANIIYLGETHDRPQDHQAQLDIIRSLYEINPRLVIGLEMFQRPYQSVLDRYLKGDLSEVELLEQSQYNQRWGFPWQFYAPILRLAKEYRLPLLALNTPSEVTRKVARQGLASLTPTEQEWIPPLSDIDTSNSVYRNKIKQVYEDFHHGKDDPQAFERFWQAQVLWDETMAATIADYVRRHPDRLVVVLAGQGHVAFGYGIPSRVARRLAGQLPRPLRQTTVLLNPDPELRQANSADYFWTSKP